MPDWMTPLPPKDTLKALVTETLEHLCQDEGSLGPKVEEILSIRSEDIQAHVTELQNVLVSFMSEKAKEDQIAAGLATIYVLGMIVGVKSQEHFDHELP